MAGIVRWQAGLTRRYELTRRRPRGAAAPFQIGHYGRVLPDDLVLVDPWWDVRGTTPEDEAEQRRIAGELTTEVSPDHALHGKDYEVVGRCWARDDVLLKLADGRWALVHLTYGGQESAPFPSTSFFDSVEAVERELSVRD